MQSCVPAEICDPRASLCLASLAERLCGREEASLPLQPLSPHHAARVTLIPSATPSRHTDGSQANSAIPLAADPSLPAAPRAPQSRRGRRPGRCRRPRTASQAACWPQT
uniref:Uncharacterized protein n=1 Tax=Tetraselmis sp. GSL018 TaxID=582737 RepID=A0A061RLY2_9CHLO